MTAITPELLDLHLRHTDERFESQLASCRMLLAEQRESSQRSFEERFESSQRLFEERFKSITKRQDEQLELFRAESIQEREKLKEFSRDCQAIHAQEYAAFRRDIKEDIIEFKKDSKSLRITVVLTGIGTATSIIFGVATFNSTLISSFASSFDVGKQLAQMAGTISADLNEVRERDRRFNAQQSPLALQRDAPDATTILRPE